MRRHGELFRSRRCYTNYFALARRLCMWKSREKAAFRGQRWRRDGYEGEAGCIVFMRTNYTVLRSSGNQIYSYAEIRKFCFPSCEVRARTFTFPLTHKLGVYRHSVYIFQCRVLARPAYLSILCEEAFFIRSYVIANSLSPIVIIGTSKRPDKNDFLCRDRPLNT